MAAITSGTEIINDELSPLDGFDMDEYFGIKSKKKTVKLLPLPQPQLRAHGHMDKSKRPESHPTTECTRACVLCLKTEPKY
jgi:hypothetical protein